MPCARWSICQQRRSPFWNISSMISTITTAVALRSFRYPKIRGSELVPCAVVGRVGWFKMQVFWIPVFWKSVRSCWNSILSVPNVVSHRSDKRADSLGANSCSKNRKGVSPSSQPIPLVAAGLQIFYSTSFPKFRSPDRLFLKANPKIWNSFSNSNPDLHRSSPM
jgi:hypothetical protein